MMLTECSGWVKSRSFGRFAQRGAIPQPSSALKTNDIRYIRTWRRSCPCMRRMNGKSKLALALLGIALLIFNPLGVCAAAPSHPCCPGCPAPPAPHHGNGTSTCVCFDLQPAPALPPLDNGYSVPVAIITSAPAIRFETETAFVSNRADVTHEARFLTLHQILV